MDIKVSKELLGLAILVIGVIFVVKGFYLSWWEEVVQLRADSQAIDGGMNNQSLNAQKINIMESRLVTLETLRRERDLQPKPITSAALTQFLDGMLTGSEGELERITLEEDGLNRYRLLLTGSTKQLTAALHDLENSPFALSILEVTMLKKEKQTMEVMFEALP